MLGIIAFLITCVIELSKISKHFQATQVGFLGFASRSSLIQKKRTQKIFFCLKKESLARIFLMLYPMKS